MVSDGTWLLYSCMEQSSVATEGQHTARDRIDRGYDRKMLMNTYMLKCIHIVVSKEVELKDESNNPQVV